MSTVINEIIKKIVPTCDPKDSIIKYVNPCIEKLYKIKSKLISQTITTSKKLVSEEVTLCSKRI